MGFPLPAFTPSLTLNIAPITGAFWGWTRHWTQWGNDATARINPSDTDTRGPPLVMSQGPDSQQPPRGLRSPSPASSGRWLASAKVNRSPFLFFFLEKPDNNVIPARRAGAVSVTTSRLHKRL